MASGQPGIYGFTARKITEETMKNKANGILAAILAAVMCLTLLSSCSGGGEGGESESTGGDHGTTTGGHEYVEPENGFFGIDIGFSSANGRKLDTGRIADLLEIMNAGAVRNSVSITTLLTDPETANEKQLALQKEWIGSLSKRGITKVMLSGTGWFHTAESGITDRFAVPAWSDAADSDFAKWLDIYEKSWKTVASLFPEIRYFEIGSALNTDEYLHPADYLKTGKAFGTDSRLEIITEMCYAASRGIHSANPDAVVVFPGILTDGDGDGAKKLLKKVYRNIGSGQYGGGSKETDDYFGAVAIQYRSESSTFDSEKWLAACEGLYGIMKDYGDGDKKVIVSEFGFSDSGNEKADALQADNLKKALESMKKISYIGSVYVYRMLDGSEDAAAGARCFGLFSVKGKSGFVPKSKAEAVCSFFGGRPDQLNKYEKPTESEEPIVIKEQKPLSYLCTWGRQSYAASKMGLSGSGNSEMRDALTAQSLFGTESYYHIIPREYRSGLIFLIDDGWDVPIGTSADGSRTEFGSMLPDPVKFGSLGSTAQEMLNGMSKKAKELGYAGLGLWVSPQIPGESFTSAEEARSYWVERAKMSNEAGILYWKVDWGKHQTDTEYRKMMTEVCAEYAPGLTVEHAYTQVPFTESNPDSKFLAEREKAIKALTALGGVIRIYDLSAPFETVCALGRTDQVLRLAAGSSAACSANVESEGYIGAVLGLPVGIMSYDTEMKVYLRWQKHSPAFDTSSAEYRCSDTVLTDTHYFEKELFPGWFECANKLLTETAPAVMSRGCELPAVTAGSNGIIPYVAASKNPITGAYSIGSFPRSIDPNTEMNGNADVTAEVGSSESEIGIFGYFGKLTLTFDGDISGYSVYAKDILSDGGLRDITGMVSVKGDRLTVDGTVIRTVGKEARGTNDETPPAMMLVIRPAE